MLKINDSISNVIYPSNIFLLERHEIFPYERFAYNALKVGVPALKEKLDNNQFDVNMSDDSSFITNFSIGRFESDDGYVINTNAYTPPLLLVFCKYFEKLFIDDELFLAFCKKPEKFRDFIKDYSGIIVKTFTNNRNKLISDWVRDLFNNFNLDIKAVCGWISEYYDLCCKIIAYHEVAHAYVGQLFFSNSISKNHVKAFEYAADLVSTEWFYNTYIRNTPNTQEYREFRRIETYNECLTTNYHVANKTYFMMLLYIGISKALLTDGSLDLDGGRTHPNSLSRLLMQRMHFDTFCMSNYSEVFTKDYMSKSDTYFGSLTELFVKSGVIQQSDLKAILKIKEDFNDLKEIIKNYNIENLKMLLNIFDN